MRPSTILTASIFACLLTATTVHALTISYGREEIAKAGVGCVGGWMSDHGNTAFFRGNTVLLNEQLAVLAKDERSYQSVKVVLHAGISIIDAPEEQPGFTSVDDSPRKITVDWSVCKSCPYDKVVTGRCKCNEQNVTIHVWVANQIRLEELSVPKNFHVESAGEIDKFVKSRAVKE